FTWLEDAVLDGELTGKKMEALRMVGVPYTDEDIANAKQAVVGKTELDAVVFYLQTLGLALKDKQ
ncbi:MAG: peptidase S41, partial [Kangiellaceae bacterium]